MSKGARKRRRIQRAFLEGRDSDAKAIAGLSANLNKLRTDNQEMKEIIGLLPAWLDACLDGHRCGGSQCHVHAYVTEIRARLEVLLAKRLVNP